MRSQSHTTQFDAFTIGNVTIRCHRFIRQIATPVEVSFASVHHELTVKFARNHGRPGSTLELRKTAAMVEMCVAVQQKLYVFSIKTKLFDIGLYLRQHLYVAGI